MDGKINTLFDYIKTLCESDLDRIINFVLGIVSACQQPVGRPGCPYCNSKHIIKYGHKDGKQRFLCKDCQQTYMLTTNTLMAGSHYSRSIWHDFIPGHTLWQITGLFSRQVWLLPSDSLQYAAQSPYGPPRYA